ncbi:MAG: autotransporter outer membrane beta-barrel domain-containing protein, partial [Rhizobiaceae bacterium]
MDLALTSTATELQVSTTSNGVEICDIATNPQTCLAGESLASDSEVRSYLNSLTTVSELDFALATIAGEVHASFRSVMIGEGERRSDMVIRRLASAFPASSEDPSAYGLALGNGAAVEGGWWASAYGERSDIDATTLTAALDTQLYGWLIGVDGNFDNGWNGGIVGGNSNNKATLDAVLSQSKSNTWSLGAYGGGEVEQVGLRLGAFYNWHSVDADRTAVVGVLQQSLTASYDAKSWQAFAEAGYE